MFLKKQLIFLFFILSSWFGSVGNGQSFAFQQYTTEDGLAGSTVYSMVQDENQSLWIATDGGLSRYDGKTFKPLEDENAQGEIIKLYKDSKSRIWMTDLAFKMSYLENGILKKMKRSGAGQPISYFYEDFSNNYWLFNKGKISVVKNAERDTFFTLSNFDMKFSPRSNAFIPLGKNENIVVSGEGIDYFKNYQHVSTKKFEKPLFKGDPSFFVNYDSSIILSNFNRVFKVSLKNHTIESAFTGCNENFDTGINNLFVDSNQDLWICTRDGVLYFQKQKDGTVKKNKLLAGYVIQDVFQDFEKNYWIMTQREGVFKLSSLQVQIYQNDIFGDQVAVVNSFSDKEIVVGYNNNWICVLDEKLQEVFSKKLFLSNEEIYDFAVDEKKENVFIVANFGVLKMDKRKRLSKEIARASGYKTAIIGDDGSLWLGNYSSLINYKSEDEKKTILKKRTYAICKVNKNELWAGTVEGLYHCKNDQCEKVKSPKLHVDIRDLQMDKNGMLWVATQGKGIFIYKDGVIVKHLSYGKGISSNNCQKILLEENYAWVATNNGINKINLTDYASEIIRKDDGLPSNEVKYLHLVGNRIYAATNNGLAVFDKNFETYTQPPFLTFSNIEIGRRDTVLQSSYEIPHDQNDISITFNANTFKNSDEVIYQYKMSEVNKDWVTTKLNMTIYTGLPHGDYTFSLRAKSLNSDWTAERKISFLVKKAYWETYWFFSLIAVVAFLFGAILFQLVIAAIKRRNAAQQKLKAYQMTALRAQMDPHFIFNALNSIQDFVMQEDKRSANHYLTQFSKLMRNILEVSDRSQISLQKEINYLKSYLSLEALRFEPSLDYEFEVEDSIGVDSVFIPSMLIQPYVENSIKHGLMHRKGEKKLWIRFLQKEDYLLCEIEDNGIGRTASREINLRNARVYQSRAMSLTKARIDLLNSADASKLGLEIEDLENSEGMACGTKVMIRIFKEREKQ